MVVNTMSQKSARCDGKWYACCWFLSRARQGDLQQQHVLAPPQRHICAKPFARQLWVAGTPRGAWQTALQLMYSFSLAWRILMHYKCMTGATNVMPGHPYSEPGP